MLTPYKRIGKAIALFKAAGLEVPACGRDQKRRLWNAWVDRYGEVEEDVFSACVNKLLTKQKFPRFYDMDEAVKAELQLRKRKAEIDELRTRRVMSPAEQEANRKRLRELIEHLQKR